MTDIPQMPSEFVEIVPPSHSQGNCIHFAAIRWPDFVNRPSFERPFAQIFTIQTHPSRCFHLAADFPGLLRNGSSSQIINQAQDFLEQASWHGNLGQLEGGAVNA
jgi:hypothetical protein